MNFLRKILFFFILTLSYSASAQTYVYSYIDPCTGVLKNIDVPSDGVTVNYFGQMNTFQPNDFNNGTFNQWATNVYNSFGNNNPCGSLLGVSTVLDVAQTTALNTINILGSLSALSDIQSSAFNSNAVTITTKSSSKKSKSKKRNNQNETSQSGETTQPGGTNQSGGTTQSGGTNGGSSQSGGTNGGSSQSGGTNGGSSQSGETTQSGGTNQSGETTQSGGTNGGSSQSGETTQSGGTNGSSQSGGTTQSGGTNGGSSQSGGTTQSGGTNQSGETTQSGGTNGGTNQSGETTQSGGTNGGSSQSGETTQSGGTNSGTNQSGGTGETTQPGGTNGGTTQSSGQSNAPENGTAINSGTEDNDGKTNILGGTSNSIQNGSGDAGGSNNPKSNAPTIVLSSDFAGFNFVDNESSFGGKATGGYTSLRWDGRRTHGLMVDYTSIVGGPNITGFYGFIGKRRIDLISVSGTASFIGRGSLYATTAVGQMWSFEKVKNLKAIYMLTASFGNVFGEDFIGTAAIAGGMYDLKVSKRIDVKLTALYIYAPYISYYNDIVLNSPHVILPLVGTNIGITKKFKLNVNFGGTYALNQNVMNYTIMAGTRFVL
jgi:hypothetical protein